jgi:integrase
MGERLFKRGGIWYAWVPQIEGGLRKVSTRCTSKKAAAAAQIRFEREALDPAHATANRATVQKIVDDYYRSRQRLGRSEGTMHHLQVKLGNVLRYGPELGREVTHERMLQYVDARLACWALVPRVDERGIVVEEGRRVRRTTVKKELRAFKAALKLARRNRLFAGDPSDVIPELEDDYAPRKRVLAPWELVGLCFVLPPHRAAHVVFIVATGARWSESVSALEADWESEHIPLRGTKTAAAARAVPRVYATLLRWAAAQPHWSEDENGERETREEGEGPAKAFAPWGNVRRDLAAACARLGIPPVSPNDLRRTFATWLRASGVEPSLLAAAMGHTTSRMVEQVYGRLNADDLGRLLMERVSGMNMGGSRSKTRGSKALPASPQNADPPEEKRKTAVPRDGIEPPTRGFSILRNSKGNARKKHISAQRGSNVGGVSADSRKPRTKGGSK